MQRNRILNIGPRAHRFPGTKVYPGVLFDPVWYAENNALNIKPGLAWSHFCEQGWKLGANPCAGFDTNWYVGYYSDVRASRVNPLLHYIVEGDTKNYLPHPLFDTAWYRERNPDLAHTAPNMLAHYLEHGFYEGRAPIDLFDDYWYLMTYQDVARSRTLPIYHYAKHGAFENRNPSAAFDTSYYKRQNADVPFENINPLFHYVRHGRDEGRASRGVTTDVFQGWIDRNENRGPTSRLDAELVMGLFSILPKFSIVVPTYNTPLQYLREFIRSVKEQQYVNWELCIVDDASTVPHVREELLRHSNDPRIKLAFNKSNLHISGATNEAIKLATGDFICLMDHDDLISPNALFEFALRLNIDPKLDMIYSDEDKMSVLGERYEPFFKPDWSPEYLESCMYTAHFACYRKTIVDRLGGFRSQYNGAQDYDFVLRFVQETQRIAHVPKILYHWRAIPGSTAQSMDNKDYVIDSAVRALRDYLVREGSTGRVEANRFGGCFDVVRDVKGKPKVSIVIPTAARPMVRAGRSIDLIANCVRGISCSSYDNYEIVIVHNGNLSEDQDRFLKSYNVKLIEYKEPFNVARKMNLGAQAASGEYLLFLNDDIEPIGNDWIESMLSLLQKPGVGCVGAKLLFESGDIQHVGVTFAAGMPDHVMRGAARENPGYFFSNVSCRNWQAVTGACLLCPTKIFKLVGGFDEEFPVNYNDIDLCLKIVARGLRCVMTPHALLYHFESQNRARTVAQEEIDLFERRWPKLSLFDPFYSENFRRRPPDFQLVLERDDLD